MRKLATVETISEIKEHKNADALELATVKGWQVVVKKGEYRPGDKIVYFEIDSWMPDHIAPFLSKGREPREYNGVKGERLRTAKLRGEISQGLILPLEILFFYTKIIGHTIPFIENGSDVSNELNIQKWEPAIPACLSGQVEGEFPKHLVPKTDQERIQNCFNDLNKDSLWEVTVKVDGSSMTVIHNDEKWSVCSRNLQLKVNDDNKNNSFVKKFFEIKSKLDDLIQILESKYGHRNFAIQGELYGEGIQGNPEKIKGQDLAIFDIYNINERSYLASEPRRLFCENAKLSQVPLAFETFQKTPESISKALEMAEGPSVNAKKREGVVFKDEKCPEKSFKVISNNYLLKQK